MRLCRPFLEPMKSTSLPVFPSLSDHTQQKKGKIVKISNAMRFLDSFLVVTQSLHFLAKTLKKEDFALLREHFSSVYPQVHWTLFSEKGFFPYSYLHSFEKFSQPQPAYGDDWKNTLTGKIDVTEDQ